MISTQYHTDYSKRKLYRPLPISSSLHVNAGFIPVAWRADLSGECLFQEGRVYKIDLHKITTSSTSDTSVLATNMLNLTVFRGGQCVGPRGLFWVQCSVYGFSLNMLCGHATRQEGLSLCCFCCPLMLHERFRVNLLQNFFCYEKTPICQTWNSIQMCISFWYSQRDQGAKGKIYPKIAIQVFRSWKICCCEYSQNLSKSLPKKTYMSTYWKYIFSW